MGRQTAFPGIFVDSIRDQTLSGEDIGDVYDVSVTVSK